MKKDWKPALIQGGLSLLLSWVLGMIILIACYARGKWKNKIDI